MEKEGYSFMRILSANKWLTSIAVISAVLFISAIAHQIQLRISPERYVFSPLTFIVVFSMAILFFMNLVNFGLVLIDAARRNWWGALISLGVTVISVTLFIFSFLIDYQIAFLDP